MDKSYDVEERSQKAFDKEKVYLNPKLNIVELAIAVGTTRTKRTVLWAVPCIIAEAESIKQTECSLSLS